MSCSLENLRWQIKMTPHQLLISVIMLHTYFIDNHLQYTYVHTGTLKTSYLPSLHFFWLSGLGYYGSMCASASWTTLCTARMLMCSPQLLEDLFKHLSFTTGSQHVDRESCDSFHANLPSCLGNYVFLSTGVAWSNQGNIGWWFSLQVESLSSWLKFFVNCTKLPWRSMGMLKFLLRTRHETQHHVRLQVPTTCFLTLAAQSRRFLYELRRLPPKKNQVPSALSHRSCLDQEVHPPRHTSVVLMRYDQGLGSTGKGLEGELDLNFFLVPRHHHFFGPTDGWWCPSGALS